MRASIDLETESGFTLMEILVMLALVAVMVATATALGAPMLAREAMRGAIYDVQTQLQMARIEAIDKNREVRLLLSPGSRTLLVSDTLGTISDADDRVLHRTNLPRSLSFATPDGAAPVTLKNLGSGWFGVSFDSDGTVVEGQGTLALGGTSGYRRLEVFRAGGTRVAKWDGSGWLTEGF